MSKPTTIQPERRDDIMTYHFGRGWSRSIPYLLLLPGVLFYLSLPWGHLWLRQCILLRMPPCRGHPSTGLGWKTIREFLFMGQASMITCGRSGRTLVFCFFVTTIQFAIGLFVAVIINQKLVGRNIFRTLYFMPVILGAVIQGLIWSLFLYPVTGPLAKFLGIFGLQPLFLGGQPRKRLAGSSLSRSGPIWAQR